MFANFSLLKNFHNKKIHFKYPLRISSKTTQILKSKYSTIIFRCQLAGPKNTYKYLILKKSKINDFEILRRNLSSGLRLRNKNNGFPGGGPPPKVPKAVNLLLTLFTLFVLYGVWQAIIVHNVKIEYISWEEFKRNLLARGEVKRLIIRMAEREVLVQLHHDAFAVGEKVYMIKIPDIGQFEDKLREAEEELGISITDRIPVHYHSNEKTDTSLLGTTVTCLLLFIVLRLGIKFLQRNFLKMMPSARRTFTIIDPLKGDVKGIKFSDVAGLKEAKTEIMDFVDYLKRPEVYRKLGAKVPKGALLLGPPGCGKTLLAKAVSTEAGVPFLSVSGSEFIQVIGGVGAARVRALFAEAKKIAPCIIYIDEIDAIGRKRNATVSGHIETEHTLNQLLVEMDGMLSNAGIILLASTNRADVLDTALMRPGRFDRHILIDLPTFIERQEIFEHHLKCVSLEKKPEAYSKRMAHLTPGFSGADIANVCNEAALHAARYKKKIVQADDLEYAVERVVGGMEKRNSARTPEERKMFAYYESGRALVGWMSKYGEALLKITIVARTDTPAGWTHLKPSEKHLYSTEDLRGKMSMGLAGRAAITLMFNRVTTAGEKDLEKVSKLAYAQVRRFGMNKNIGLMSFDISGKDNAMKKPYSKVLGNLFDQEARRLVAEVYKETEELLVKHKDKLIKLAEALLQKETLNYDDVVQLIGPPAYEGKKLVEPLEFALTLDKAVGA